MSESTNFTVSVVPTPKCGHCGEVMAPASATKWACENRGCVQYDIPAELGVYPALHAREIHPKDMSNISMGCHVAEPVCSLCEED